jgi:hypothetical protein
MLLKPFPVGVASFDRRCLLRRPTLRLLNGGTMFLIRVLPPLLLISRIGLPIGGLLLLHMLEGFMFVLVVRLRLRPAHRTWRRTKIAERASLTKGPDKRITSSPLDSAFRGLYSK